MQSNPKPRITPSWTIKSKPVPRDNISNMLNNIRQKQKNMKASNVERIQAQIKKENEENAEYVHVNRPNMRSPIQIRRNKEDEIRIANQTKINAHMKKAKANAAIANAAIAKAKRANINAVNAIAEAQKANVKLAIAEANEEENEEEFYNAQESIAGGRRRNNN